METTDWKRWLPPRAIRSRGEVEFRIGQVWAWRAGDDPIVFRVLQTGRGKDASCKIECLARSKYPAAAYTMRAYGSMVLVQDVGMAPWEPDELWQRTYAMPPDICYAPACTRVRVVARDAHGKTYCWVHRALWGTVTEEVEDDRAMIAMGRAAAAYADKLLLNAFAPVPTPQRMRAGDCVSMGDDGRVCAATMEDRVPIGVVIGRTINGHLAVRQGFDTSEYLPAIGLDIADLPQMPLPPLPSDSPNEGTFSNLFAPMKPLTAKSLLDAMAEMDRIKARDLDTKKRYDDLVMSAFKEPVSIPRSFRYDFGWKAPIPLDDMPPVRLIPKTEKEIYQLQKLNDADRARVNLFPVVPERLPRTQSQSICAGLGIWGTRGDAKLRRDPPPYPHVSDEDLLPDV